jgi:hypothetical protein
VRHGKAPHLTSASGQIQTSHYVSSEASSAGLDRAIELCWPDLKPLVQMTKWTRFAE